MTDQDAAPLPREPVVPPGSELDERVDELDVEVRAKVSASAAGKGTTDDDQEVVAEDLEVAREQDESGEQGGSGRQEEQGQASTEPPD